MMMIAMITQSHNDDYGGTGVMTINGDSITMIDGGGGYDDYDDPNDWAYPSLPV